MHAARSLARVEPEVTGFTLCCSVLDSGLGEPLGISMVSTFQRLSGTGSGD